MDELRRLGLDPKVLNQLLQPKSGNLDSASSNISPHFFGEIAGALDGAGNLPVDPTSGPGTNAVSGPQFQPHAMYELTGKPILSSSCMLPFEHPCRSSDEGDGIIPRLRLWVDSNAISFPNFTEGARFVASSEEDTCAPSLMNPNNESECRIRHLRLAIAMNSEGDPAAGVDPYSSSGFANNVNPNPPSSMSVPFAVRYTLCS